MIRKTSLYSLALLAWGVVVFGVTVAVFSGRTAPFLTPSMLPVNGVVGFVAFPGSLLVVGGLAIDRLEKRSWRRTGRRANLSPDGRGVFGEPDLVGTRDGRTVRVRTVKRKTGGGESGSSKSTFTIVEADLENPAAEGLVIGTRGDGSLVDLGDAPVDLESETVGDFAVIGMDPEMGADVLTDRARSALATPSLNGSVLAGNASEVVMEAVPDGGGTFAGRITDAIKHHLERTVPGDAATVRTETKGVLLDDEEMTQQIAAVVAVADGFERAIERSSSPSVGTETGG